MTFPAKPLVATRSVVRGWLRPWLRMAMVVLGLLGGLMPRVAVTTSTVAEESESTDETDPSGEEGRSADARAGLRSRRHARHGSADTPSRSPVTTALLTTSIPAHRRAAELPRRTAPPAPSDPACC